MSQLRNKFLKLFLAAGLILGVMTAVSAQSLPGSGTESDPYQIDSASDTCEVKLGSNNDFQTQVYYEFISDVNFNDQSFSDVCSGSRGTGNDVINGNGYTISNFRGGWINGDIFQSGGVTQINNLEFVNGILESGTNAKGIIASGTSQERLNLSGLYFENIDINNDGSVVRATTSFGRNSLINSEFRDIEFNTNNHYDNGRTGLIMGSAQSSSQMSYVENVVIENFQSNTGYTGSDVGLIDGLQTNDAELDGIYRKVYVNNVSGDIQGLLANNNQDGIEFENVLLNDVDFNGAEGNSGYFVGGGQFSSSASTSLIVGLSEVDDYEVTSSNNVAYDSDTVINDLSGISGVTGYTTSELQGSTAETTLSGFDFTNIWSTTSEYPTFQFTLEPIASLVDTDIGTVNTGSQVDIDYDISTRGGSATYEFVVVEPDGTTNTVRSDSFGSGTSQTLTASFTPTQSGVHDYYVNIDGNKATPTGTFEAIDYNPPSVSLTSPVSETVSGYSNQENVGFQFEISNADVNGEYFVQIKNSSEPSSAFEDIGSGTFSSGESSISDSFSVSLPSSGVQDKDWRVRTEDSFGSSTSSSATLTVERLPKPNVNIETPSEGQIFYTDSGSTVQVPFEGWVNNSQESGEAFAKARKDNTDGFETSLFSDSIGTVSTGDQFVSGDLLVDTGDYSDGRIQVNFNSGATFSTNSVNFEVRDGTPKIDSYNVTSDEVTNLENIKAGDYFDITLEGTKTASDIDYIQYKIASPTQSFEVFQREPNYQDANIYTDSVDNAFEMKESWEGKTLNIDAQVFDVEGRQSDTQRVQVQTGTPPDNFLLNSPSVGEFFLIPEGQNNVEVDIEYGVDSSELSGDLKLYVNGQQQATQSVAKNTQQTFTYTDTYTEGTKTWYLEWTDSTGETYTSSTSNFEVSQYPLGLSLDSPSQGESVQIDTEPGTVEHLFTVSSDAFTGDWYYDFRLTNGNGTVVEERTSEVFSGVTQQFTESVDGIEEGSYTYNVSVYDDSDNSQIITKSKSYDTVFDPLFNQEIDSPGDGNTYLVQPGETRNVSYGFSVETFEDATDFTLSLDRNTVTTESVGTQSSETFTGEFTGLGTGTYNVELTGEDASGRSNSTSVSFSVEEAESENESVEINTIEFTPSLDEARPGDELDVYIEGSGKPENVDFVEIELEIAGDTETIIVPTDELQEGSWFWQGSTGLTVKESWAGATAKVTGTVTDIAGRTSRFFREYVLGSELEMFGVLNTPQNGDVFLMENGTEENIPFQGEVRASFDNINYEIQANDQNLFGGSLQPEETTEFSRFFKPSAWSLNQFGEYKATILLTNSETNEQKSYTNTFEIVEDTGQPVVTISDPGQNAQIETPRGDNDAEVTMRYRIQTNESGTTSLVLENLDEGRQEINIGDIDEQVSDQEASSGEAFRTVDTTLDKGTYLMRASFEDDSGQNASRERTFQIVEEAYEPEEEVDVSLVEPQEGEEIPQNFGTNIEWQAVHDQGVGVPNSTFYVEDSGDNIVYTDTRDAPNSGEGNVYSGYLDADLEPGNYQFYADLQLESQTLETQKRNLTVLDSQAPETSLQNQDLGSFRQGEDGVANIEADFTTETFQQDATIELVTRPEGTNDGTVRFTAQQDGFREDTYQAEWQNIESGKYEYYIRMEANPTYTSDTGTYTVEDSQFEDPVIKLDGPEQGEVFNYNNTNASVPFRFDSEAYTTGDTNFTLLLETVSEDNSELESIDSFTLSEEDGLLEYNKNFELDESGYRYQVVAEYEDQTWGSETRSFVVNDVDTEQTETPRADEGFGILSRISNFGERLLGDESDFILGFGLLLITSVGVTVRTSSDKIGLATMVGVALGLSYVGVFPSWIAAVFTLMSVGIAVWTVNLLVEGRGEL